MPKQIHEARYGCSITTLFAALVSAAARGRWASQALPEQGPPLPAAGCSYAALRGTVLRRGKVVEVLRPVALTLQETLRDPPCCVSLRLRWRLEPLDSGALARLDVRYSLNGAATLRARHWRGRIGGHCERLLAATRGHVERLTQPQDDTGTSGQNHGSASMTRTNKISVNGKPSFR